MLHPFVSDSRSHGLPSAGGASLSLLAHASLVALVVALARAGPVTENARAFPFEHVIFTRPAPLASPPALARRASRHTRGRRVDARAAATARRRRLLDFSALTTAAPIAPTPVVATPAAVLDLHPLVSSPSDFAGGEAGVLRAALGAAYARPTADGAYTEDVVERTVWPARGNPRPEYPRALLSRRMEARFLVRYVVDSTGRVDRGSIVIPSTIHRLFADAVRYALLHSRFLPAEIGGLPVRQHVQQLYTFRLADE